jgi:hypothetical protein
MLIGLSGYARSGKDTVADHLINEFNFSKYSFAAPMKEAMYILNPKVAYDYEDIDYRHAVDTYGIDEAKVKYPEIRRLLQVFGTEVGRSMFGEDFWVEIALGKIKSFHSVISDVRFPNEAEAIRAKGGVVWRVNRPGIKPITDHPSEIALDDYPFDLTLFNDSNVEELYKKVEIGLTQTIRK